MIYRDFQDLKLSALGMGCMRLPVIGGDDARVDEDAAAEMVDYAMANGVNYYDTAWGYHSGNSELVLGRALARHPRDSFYIADKFPGYDLSNMPKVQEIFEAQLKKCQVDHFDFYLFHNVCEMNIDAYLDPRYGIHDYLMEQKKNGRIRHLGFSCHGNLPVLKRFLEAYGKDMEFCQLQLNYIDWTFQNGREKVELLDSWHIPVWVMEPLRGGRLARLSDEEAAPLRAMRPEEPIPAWAFRFLQSIPSVTMILSGMSDLEQLKANIATFQEDRPLSQGELDGLLEQAERYRELKPIHTQLNAIHRKGQREKFKAAHEGELRQFYMARRKLEPHFTPEGKLPLTKWRTERGKLQQAYQEDYAKYKPIRDDLMKLYQVKSTVDTARRQQEQAHTQRRDRDMER